MASDRLTEPILAYLKEVVKDFRCSNLPVYAFEEIEWIKGDNGHYQRVTVNRPSLGGFLHHHKERSALYTGAAAAIRDDSVFGMAVGCMVGDEGRLMRFDCDSVIGHAADTLAKRNGTVSVSRPEVSRRLDEIRRYLTEPQRSDTMIIPLPGLQCTRFPFKIDDGIEIDTLTADEVGSCVGSGVLRPLSNDMPFLSAEECVGVRVRVPTSLMIVSQEEFQAGQEDRMRRWNRESNRPHKFGTVSRWKMADCVDDLLFVLRLARSDFVATLGAVLVSNRPPGQSRTWIGRPTRNFVRTSYEIDRTTARRIRALWRDLKAQAGCRRALPSICERRFNAAMDRVSLDDAILDHLVAAEALFLKDAGSPEERGELGFRLALRASRFLETGGADRLALHKFMKRAYELRSGIAHGGSSPAAVKVPGRSDEVPLHEFVDELSAVMGRALRTAIPLYLSDPAFGSSDYWDLLIVQ